MKHRSKNGREAEMREITERKSYNPRRTRNLFVAGMTGLLFIIAAVSLYVLL